MSVSYEGGKTMKSKRIIFVLFTCVFALYGCVSSSAVATDAANYGISLRKNTKPQMFSIQENSDMKVNTLKEYAKENKDVPILVGVRDVNGEMKLKNDVDRIGNTLLTSAKEEQARQAEEARKKVEEERLEKENTIVSPRITTYGLDCYGCQSVNGRGGTAMGVGLDLQMGVQQPDGSWLPGIRYGNYFIIAADRSVPMCSIVKISNHGLSGEGISADQPIYAIVLDRGGGISGSHFDLYVGSEQNNSVYRASAGNPSAVILRKGGQVGNSCAL